MFHPGFPYNTCPSPVCERIVLQVQYHHLYLGWWCYTSILRGLRVRSRGGLRCISSGWEATPGYGRQHLSPQGWTCPNPGQVAEYLTQACGVVEADTPPCWRAKGRKNTVCPLPAAHRRSTNTDFSAGFPRYMPGSLKEIYISDLIQLS